MRFDRNALDIDYDYQRDDGTLEWIHLRFNEVSAYKFCQAVCCAAEHIVGFDVMARYTESAWRDERIEHWKEWIGWQESQKQQGGESRFHHFRIFFDDAGCVDVLASSYEIHDHPRP